MIVTVTIEGKMPLIMHSQAGMNPRDPIAQKLAALQSKRGKTLEDRLQISDLEFHLGLYYDRAMGPYLPYLNVKRSIQDGAKQLKLGTHVMQALRPDPDCFQFPLLYDGPRDLQKLLKEETFRDVRTVVVSKRVVERTRPIFRQWKLQAQFILDTDRLDVRKLKDCVKQSGEYIGLGDYRPEYGLYTAVVEHKEN